MSENEEPDWLAKGGEALRRQVELLLQTTEQFIGDARRAKGAGGQALSFYQQIALAFDARLRELVPPRERHVVGHSTISGSTAIVSVTAIAGLATATGSAGMPQVHSQAERSIGQILALVLLWMLVLVIPAAAWDAKLSPEVQALVDAYDGILASVAVAITFDIFGKRNKR